MFFTVCYPIKSNTQSDPAGMIVFIFLRRKGTFSALEAIILLLLLEPGTF